MGSLEIRDFSLPDLEGVIEVLTASFSEEAAFWGFDVKEAPKMLRLYRMALALQKVAGLRFKFFVAKVPGEVVGTTMIESRRHFAYLEAVAVHPAHRGQGIARALVSQAIQEAFSWGLDRVVLRVREDNLPAKRLYLSLGFQPFERILTLAGESGESISPTSLPPGLRLLRVGGNDPRLGKMLENTRDPKAREVYGPPKRPSPLARALSSLGGGKEESAILLKDNAPLGLYQVWRRKEGPVQLRVELLPEFRGQGLGEVLLAQAVFHGASLGKRLVFQTNADQKELVEAALRRGFTEAFAEESMVLVKGAHVPA